MAGLIKQLQEKEDFSEAEGMIADYLLENFRLIAGMTTRQLAKAAYTNSAAIVRFSQKLGFGGSVPSARGVRGAIPGYNSEVIGLHEVVELVIDFRVDPELVSLFFFVFR